MSTNKLTDQQVIERLAAREGWTKEGKWWLKPNAPKARTGSYKAYLPDYLHDHAALQRVLRLLTKPERKRLMENLFARSRLEPDWLNTWFFEEWLLLLPTADLARLVAEVMTS